MVGAYTYRKVMPRSIPPIQFVFDSHGHMIDAKDSQVDSYSGFSNMDGEAQNVFKNFNDGVGSTMKWATIALLLVSHLKCLKFESCLYVLLLVSVSVVVSNQKKRLLFYVYIYSVSVSQ